MRDAGYDIIIIQECITKTGHRDANGVPQPDPKKFPHGMKDLVDYIHSKGLKAGIFFVVCIFNFILGIGLGSGSRRG